MPILEISSEKWIQNICQNWKHSLNYLAPREQGPKAKKLYKKKKLFQDLKLN